MYIACTHVALQLPAQLYFSFRVKASRDTLVGRWFAGAFVQTYSLAILIRISGWLVAEGFAFDGPVPN